MCLTRDSYLCGPRITAWRKAGIYGEEAAASYCGGISGSSDGYSDQELSRGSVVWATFGGCFSECIIRERDSAGYEVIKGGIAKVEHGLKRLKVQGFSGRKLVARFE